MPLIKTVFCVFQDFSEVCTKKKKQYKEDRNKKEVMRFGEIKRKSPRCNFEKNPKWEEKRDGEGR